MSEVSAILVFTTKTTQSGPQVFSVTGALTCRKLQFDVISSLKFFQIWSSVNVYGELCDSGNQPLGLFSKDLNLESHGRELSRVFFIMISSGRLLLEVF